MTRGRVAAIALAGVLAAAILVLARPELRDGGQPAPDACAAGALGPRLCVALPSFEPPPRAALPVLPDQLAPCADAGAFRPAFCIALPRESGQPDRAALLAQHRDACAQLGTVEAPEFCFTPPSAAGDDATLQRQTALALLRQRLGTDFRRVAAGTLDLWAEVAVTDETAAVADRLLREDQAAVESYFGTRFREVPAVFLFASQGSFRAALERQFGYAGGTAALLAEQYGGILVGGIDAIAINGENVLAGARPTIFRHELAHVMAHQLAGATLPLWLDEGLATLVADPDPGAFDVDRATALSILGRQALASVAFDESRSWADRNTTLAGHAYGVAAEAARLVVTRVERSGLVALLARVKGGATFASAYEAAAGEPLERFLDEVPARALAGCTRGIAVSATRPDGLVVWWIYGFPAAADVAITADGPVRYAFAVRTDRFGVQSGTVGAPMPAGTYVLRAESGGSGVEIPVVVGAATGARRQCA